MNKITKIATNIKAKNTLPTSTLSITDNRTGKHYEIPIYND